MMTNIRLISYLIIGLSILLFANSCKSTKDSTASEKDLSEERIRDIIQSHNVDYDWFCAEGKSKIDTDELTVGTKMYLRVKKDSIIWMTFKKLGVTAAQALITQDSFFIIYRLEKAYEKGGIDRMKKQLNMDLSFSEIQDYLIGNIPILQDTAAQYLKTPDGYTVKESHPDYYLETYIDHQKEAVSGIKITDIKNNKIKALYNDYQETDSGHTVAFERKFLSSIDQGYGLEIGNTKIKWSKILINQPKSTRFNIPRHYEDISID